MEKITIANPNALKWVDQLAGLGSERIRELASAVNPELTDQLINGIVDLKHKGKIMIGVSRPQILVIASKHAETPVELGALILYMMERMMQLQESPVIRMIATLGSQLPPQMLRDVLRESFSDHIPEPGEPLQHPNVEMIDINASEMAAGNNEALKFLEQLARNDMASSIVKLHEMGVKGDKLVVLYNDLAGGDLNRVHSIVQQLNAEVLEDAIERPDTGREMVDRLIPATSEV